MGCFPSDQCRFSVQSPPVCIDLYGFANHSVTGDQEGHGVFTNGPSCGLESPGIVDMFGYRLVGNQCAKGNLQQRFPDLQLEWSSFHQEFNGAGMFLHKYSLG